MSETDLEIPGLPEIDLEFEAMKAKYEKKAAIEPPRKWEHGHEVEEFDDEKVVSDIFDDEMGGEEKPEPEPVLPVAEGFMEDLESV